MIGSILGVLAWLPVVAFPILFGLFLVVPFLLDAEPPATPKPLDRDRVPARDIADRRAARRCESGSTTSPRHALRRAS